MMRRLTTFARQRPWTTLVLGVACLGLLAGGVVVSGVLRITASSGHWAITEWFLHFAMRRSVITQSLLGPTPPPDLDREALVMQGAAHYDIGCRPCHGAPGTRMPAIAAAMTPHPPSLPARILTWDARELFYIVRHGVKFTGMPAWPAARDDEVWAMVAFLRRLPGLDEIEYTHLAGGAATRAPELAAGAMGGPTPPPLVVQQCARCHGMDGRSRGVGTIPRLAGQRETYLMNAMSAYAERRRFSGMMMPIAAALTPDEHAAAARYYAALPAPPPMPYGGHGDPRRGAGIAARGLPARDVPVCDECHGAYPVDEAYPKLAGQHREYLEQQLRLLQTRTRGGSGHVHIMHEFVDRLGEQDIRDVAAHYATVR